MAHKALIDRRTRHTTPALPALLCAIGLVWPAPGQARSGASVQAAMGPVSRASVRISVKVAPRFVLRQISPALLTRVAPSATSAKGNQVCVDGPPGGTGFTLVEDGSAGRAQRAAPTAAQAGDSSCITVDRDSSAGTADPAVAAASAARADKTVTLLIAAE